MNKCLLKIISLLLVITVQLVCLCSCSLGSRTVYLNRMIKAYEENPTPKNLSNVIVASMNDMNINYINTYGEEFLFSDNKDILYNEFSSAWLELDDTFTDVSVANLYESFIWLYMYSFLYDSEKNQPRDYIESKSKINELYPLCFILLKDYNSTAQRAVLVADNYIGKSDFLETFLGVVNLSVQQTSEEIIDYAFKLSWEIAYEIEITELGRFISGLYANVFYCDKTIRCNNTTANGIISELNLADITEMVDLLAQNNETKYDDVVSIFKAQPKELLVGKYYSYNYYSNDYNISLFGSPVHSISVSDVKTGEILYTRYKLPSTSGLKWHKNQSGERQSGDKPIRVRFYD